MAITFIVLRGGIKNVYYQILKSKCKNYISTLPIPVLPSKGKTFPVWLMTSAAPILSDIIVKLNIH
jgi:hypothetical protein